MRSLAKKFLEKYGSFNENNRDSELIDSLIGSEKIICTQGYKFSYPSIARRETIDGYKIKLDDILGAIGTKKAEGWRYILRPLEKDGMLRIFSEYTGSIIAVKIDVPNMKITYENGDKDKILFLNLINNKNMLVKDSEFWKYV